MHRREFLRGVISALIAVLIFATAVTGYAWLKTDKEAAFRLGADDTPDISLQIAAWDAAQKKYIWQAPVSVEPNHKNIAPYGKPLGVDAVNSGMTPDTISSTLKVNCQFGEITNLIKLDQSNEVWFCLKIHEDEGLEIKNLRLHYAADPYQFYGAVWEGGKVTDIRPIEKYAGVKKDIHPLSADIRTALNEIQPEVKKNLMEVSRPADDLFITSTPPDQFTFPATGSPDYIRLNTGDEIRNNSTGYAGTAAAVDADHYYYVYFKARPNLDGYFNFVQKLYEYMPCYLTFNQLSVNVDVVKKPQTPAP